MKEFYFRIRKCFIVACLAMVLSPSVFAVNLIVSGITNPSAANGTYAPAGTLNGQTYWKHQTQSYYVHYSPFGGINYWNIDNDTDGAVVLFYSENNPSTTSPANVTNWYVSGSNTGTVILIEAGSATVPEINVKGNSVSIPDGNTSPGFSNFTKFGSADLSTGTITRTFTIENNGAGTLNITGVTISGVDAADFSITTAPATTLATLTNTTFIVTFNPSVLGNRNATINIANNDADEGTYNFDIQGRGFNPSNIVLSGVTSPSAANGSYIYQGTINNFEYWKHATLEYYIFNDDYSGGRYWNIDVDTNDDNTNYLYWVGSEEGTPVGLTSWTANTGITGTPVITDAIAVPEINIQGNAVTILDDDVTPSFADYSNFGSANVASGTATRTFTIQNLGGAALTLSGTSPYVTISGSNASDFTVTTAPASSIAGNSSTTFVVTFDPSAIGTRTATVNITNSDSDEGTYSFSIQGQGITPQNLIVSGITAASAANGTYIYQGILNGFQYWKHQTLNYYIYNKVYNKTPFWDIDDNLDDDATQLFYSSNHSDDYSPVNVTAWQGQSGSTTATGTGTPLIVYVSPEINLQGNSVSIASGDATPSLADYTDFGTTPVCSGTIIRTYTIQNTGAANLTISSVVLSGTNATDFTVTTAPGTTVAAAGSTTFQVTFDPSAAGTRTATITINNNDVDEGTYSFAIQGTGTELAIGAAAQTNVSCNGGSNGTASVNVATGGTSAYTYDWTPGTPTGDGSTSVTGLTAGSWTCTVTDSKSCTATQTFTVTQPSALSLTAASQTNVSAVGGSNGAASVNVPTGGTAGYTYNWTPGNPTGDGSTSVTGLTFGSWTCTATDANGCTATKSFSILQPATVTSSVVTIKASTSATLGGEIPADGGGTVTERGVVYSASNATPTIGGTGVTQDANGTGTGVFSESISGLSAFSTYYVRAYAINTAGTSYGSVVNFTTDKVQLTITAPSIASKEYDGLTDAYSVTTLGTVSGKVTGDVVNVIAASSVFDTKDVGTSKTVTVIYSLTGANASRYIVPVNSSISSGVITAKTITITANAAQSKVYGSSDPTLTYTCTPALITGDAFTGSLTRAGGENVGLYAISQGSLSAGSNYSLSIASVNFGITAKPITVTANAGQSKVYGSSDPILTYTCTPALITGDAFTGSLTRAGGENVGLYAVSQGSLSAGSNYSLSIASVNFGITTKELTVTANSQAISVGQAIPNLTFAYSGFISGDDESVLDTKPMAATGATSASIAGDYDIVVSGGSDNNYSFTYVKGILTISNKQVPVITWNNPVDITYGTALNATQFNASSSVAGVFAYSLTEGTILNAGSAQLLSVTFTPSDAVTYASVTKDVFINVSKVTLTVTADNQTMKPGDAVPALTFVYSGFVNGESASVLNVVPVAATVATSTSVIGEYDIAVSGGLDDNYDFVYVKGTLIITDKQMPVITWTNPSDITYGTALSAEQLNASTSVAGSYEYSPVLGTVLNAGEAQTLSVTFTPTDAASYTTASKSVVVNVTKAILTATANNQVIKVGGAIPALTFRYDGFVNGDDSLVLDVAPIAATTATSTSMAHSFPIILSGGSDNNYSFNYVDGTLTITSGTGTSVAKGFSYKFYPNPVQNGLTIENVTPGAQITLVTLTGVSVLSTVAETNVATIDMTGVQSGVYLVRVNDNNGLSTFKISKL